MYCADKHGMIIFDGIVFRFCSRSEKSPVSRFCTFLCLVLHVFFCWCLMLCAYFSSKNLLHLRFCIVGCKSPVGKHCMLCLPLQIHMHRHLRTNMVSLKKLRACLATV